MTNLYDDFEKRFSTNWFSAGWIEVDDTATVKNTRKELATLEAELSELEERMENIAQNQLRLANLAKLYNR